MEKTWNEIRMLLEVRHSVRTDAEWDEAKINSIEATIEAIIEKLRRALPDRC